jgi:hypothetical protein
LEREPGRGFVLFGSATAEDGDGISRSLKKTPAAKPSPTPAARAREVSKIVLFIVVIRPLNSGHVP